MRSIPHPVEVKNTNNTNDVAMKLVVHGITANVAMYFIMMKVSFGEALAATACTVLY